MTIRTTPMRHGYTTGACATAAAKGALTMLITQQSVSEAEVWLPAGFAHTFELLEAEFTRDMAQCATIKDAGDDPDATHKAKIIATVSWKTGGGIELDGGVGVGRVTKPGLPVPVGEAAINPVPRRMLMQAVESVLNEFAIDSSLGVKVVTPVTRRRRNCQKDAEFASGHYRRHLHSRYSGSRCSLLDGCLQSEYRAGIACGKKHPAVNTLF